MKMATRGYGNVCSFLECRKTRREFPNLKQYRFPKNPYLSLQWVIRSVVRTTIVDDGFLTYYIDYFKHINFNNSANLSEECKNSINGSTFWGTKLFDASSKIPVGIFETGIDNLGNFDECYEYTSISSGKTFYGKYCLGQMDIKYADPPENLDIFQTGKGSQLSSAFCLPSTCTLHDFKTLYYQHNFSDILCSSQADIGGYSIWLKITISILSLMFTMVSMATLYDWIADAKTENLFKQISAINSCKLLFSTQLQEKEFTSLYGLRCITMSWIILHHAYLCYYLGGLKNYNAFLEVFLKPENVYLAYGHLSVTTFFTIGSVLTSYNFLKHYEKEGFSVTWNCIRRYVRLTPLLTVMVLIDASLYEMGNGPVWFFTEIYLSKPCHQYWWSTLLYIQNYINPNSDCVPQAWYSAVDMQCYIIFSILLFVLSKRKRWRVPVLIALLAISAIIMFFVLYNNSLLSVMFSDNNVQRKLYYKPTHTRFGAYVAGLLIGICLHEIHSKSIVIPKKMRVLIIFFLALVMGGIFTVGYFVLEDYLGFALLMAAKEILWTGMIGGIILMCESGNADFINGFLSLPFFKILTKLTYGMYLVSLTATFIRIMSSRVVDDFSLYNLYQKFFGDFVTSLIASFLLYIFIEMPFTHIGNDILRKIRGYMKSGCCRNDVTPKPKASNVI